MSGTREKALVSAFLKTRSESDFRPLYREYSRLLYRVALQLTNGDTMASEDVIQEMWLRAIHGLPKFEWKSSLRTWLTGILLNCVREHGRKAKLSGQWKMDSGSASTLGTPPAADGNIDILNALARLPPGFRDVLVLHDIEGFTHEEIGRLLEISEGTSKSQLFHARKAMRKLLM